MATVWVRRMRLGADDGGGGGQQIKAGAVGLLFFRMGHVLGSKARRRGVFSKLFLLSNLTSENTQDQSILTEDKPFMYVGYLSSDYD